MGTTTNRSYPYPASTAAPDVPADIQALATAVDTDVNAVFGAWTAYTPTWNASTNPTLGNGTIVGRYRRTGKTLDFAFELTIGSTTNTGVGTWLFPFPVTPTFGTSPQRTWPAYMFDASGPGYVQLIAKLDNANRIVLFVPGTSASVSPSQPVTWATGDKLVFTGTVELG